MKKKEAWITGVGLIASLGSDPLTFWGNLLKGLSGTRLLTRFDPAPYSSRVAAEVRDRSFEKELSAKERKMDPTARFALHAAKQALEDSALDLNRCDGFRCGVILGSARGAAGLLEDSHSAFLAGGTARVPPSTSPNTTLSGMSAAVARRFGLRGVNFALSATCASSNHAIGLALEKIQLGKADVILAGGSEACITPFHFAQFGNAKVLASGEGDPASACRPFDLSRDGMVVGEGAGIVVIEERGHAEKRGAIPYCRVAGFGATCDALGVTSMPEDGAGLKEAMLLALKDARLDRRDVSYINAHGTGTRLNDRIESRAIKSLFGEPAKTIPVSSTKSMTGHSIGATGGIEAVICSLIIRHGKIPPTINYREPDPECDLDYVPNTARDLSVGAVLSNASGFGGLNTCLVFQKFS